MTELPELDPMHLTPQERQRADELAAGALKVANEGGDVDAYVRAWAEQETGRPLPEVTSET